LNAKQSQAFNLARLHKKRTVHCAQTGVTLDIMADDVKLCLVRKPTTTC